MIEGKMIRLPSWAIPFRSFGAQSPPMILARTRANWPSEAVRTRLPGSQKSLRNKRLGGGGSSLQMAKSRGGGIGRPKPGAPECCRSC